MPKKKHQRNGLYWFMQELMCELRREGRVFPNGMPDVVHIALPRWQDMGVIEREHYEQMAKDNKRKNIRGPANDKYKLDNVGNIVANRVDKEEETERRQIKEGKISRSRWPYGDEFLNFRFYFISFEYFWATDADDATALPVEVALVEYSFKHGITKMMQIFIKPQSADGRDIPLGYRFKCKQHSEDRHHIPITGFELAEDNYPQILQRIENFVNPNGEKKEYPPVYAMHSELNNAIFALDWLRPHGNPERLQKVYELENMVLDLYLRVEIRISRAGITALFNNTNFDYEPSVRCSWHEDEDSRFCALGTVRKACYHLSDALADYYDFELTSAHLPNKDEQAEAVITWATQDPNISDKGRGDIFPEPQPRSSYSTFASRDIRYTNANDDGGSGSDNSDYPSLGSPKVTRHPVIPPSMPWFGAASANTYGQGDNESIGSRRKSLSEAVERKTSSFSPKRQMLHDAASQQKGAMPQKQSLHEAVAQKESSPQKPIRRLLGENSLQYTKPPDGLPSVPVGRGRGRAAPAVGRGVTVGRGAAISRPVNAPGRPPVLEKPTVVPSVGRGSLIAGAMASASALSPAAAELSSAIASPLVSGSAPLSPGFPPAPTRQPNTLPLAIQRGRGAPSLPVAAPIAGQGYRVPATQPAAASLMGGRGRGNFTLPPTAEKPGVGRGRLPPGFGRGLTLEMAGLSMHD